MKHLVICDGLKTEEILPLCETYRAGIEVQSFYHPQALTQQALLDKTHELVSDISPLAMHGPFMDLNPGSFDPLIREVTQQRILAGCDVAQHLGAQHLIFHSGYIPKTTPDEAWTDNAAELWKTIQRQISPEAHIHLENLLEPTPDKLGALIEKIGHPQIHANLDVGHAHCNSNTSVVEWIEELRDKIGYVHLHDNCGHRDEHLAFGAGTIPMREVCEALETFSPQAIWAIESEGKDAIIASLEWLRHNKFIV